MQNEQNAEILLLWNEGKTASEIGSQFGLTRNTVIGKLNRMRVAGHDVKRKVIAQPPRSARKKEKNTNGPERKPNRLKPFAPRSVVERSALNTGVAKTDQLVLGLFDDAPTTNVDIMGLREMSCRFIVKTDPRRGAIYCGEPKARRSYCEKHAKICYVIATLERSDKRSDLRPSRSQRS